MTPAGGARSQSVGTRRQRCWLRVRAQRRRRGKWGSCGLARVRHEACGCQRAMRCSLTSSILGAYGRAYGFERAMDNLGAIIGPLLAIGLVAWVGTRWAIVLSVLPGLAAAVAIVYAI